MRPTTKTKYRQANPQALLSEMSCKPWQCQREQRQRSRLLRLTLTKPRHQSAQLVEELKVDELQEPLLHHLWHQAHLPIKAQGTTTGASRKQVNHYPAMCKHILLMWTARWVMYPDLCLPLASNAAFRAAIAEGRKLLLTLSENSYNAASQDASGTLAFHMQCSSEPGSTQLFTSLLNSEVPHLCCCSACRVQWCRFWQSSTPSLFLLFAVSSDMQTAVMLGLVDVHPPRNLASGHISQCYSHFQQART